MYTVWHAKRWDSIGEHPYFTNGELVWTLWLWGGEANPYWIHDNRAFADRNFFGPVFSVYTAGLVMWKNACIPDIMRDNENYMRLHRDTGVRHWELGGSDEVPISNWWRNHVKVLGYSWRAEPAYAGVTTATGWVKLIRTQDGTSDPTNPPLGVERLNPTILSMRGGNPSNCAGLWLRRQVLLPASMVIPAQDTDKPSGWRALFNGGIKVVWSDESTEKPLSPAKDQICSWETCLKVVNP